MEFKKTRVAPTPSGYLHIGNVLNFLFTAALARQKGAQILLRIDDLDKGRKRPEFVQDIFDTLNFLDIPWDEGPENADDFEANWSQTTRLQHYREAFEFLKEKKQVFACDCSRKQINQANTKGQYPGTCRPLNGLPPKSSPCNWRLLTPSQPNIQYHEWSTGKRPLTLPAHQQDFVVWKKDGLPAYQLASLIDDSHFGIDFIVRGKDLLGSTAAQLLLADALGKKAFADTWFLHHPLVLSADKKKLSKSAGSTSIYHMRQAKIRPEEVYKKLSLLLRLPKPVNSFEEFVAVYQPRLLAGESVVV